MPGMSATVTHSQAISERLAEEIIRGQLAPGTRLDEQSLATRFKVSRSPVRDALRQLAATHLVEYFPHRGFSVARLDPVGLDQMFEAAAELEALCARLCALRAGATDRKRIEHIHQQAKQAVTGRATKTYAALNEDLHRTIYAGARNKTLEGIALNLRQRLAPFRARLFFTADNRMRGSHAEHDAIVKAILAQDAGAAAEAMRDHAAHAAMNISQHFGKGTGVEPRRRRAARAVARR